MRDFSQVRKVFMQAHSQLKVKIIWYLLKGRSSGVDASRSANQGNVAHLNAIFVTHTQTQMSYKPPQLLSR